MLLATRQRWHSRPYPSRSWYSIKRPRGDARLSWPSTTVYAAVPSLAGANVSVIISRVSYVASATITALTIDLPDKVTLRMYSTDNASMLGMLVRAIQTTGGWTAQTGDYVRGWNAKRITCSRPSSPSLDTLTVSFSTENNCTAWDRGRSHLLCLRDAGSWLCAVPGKMNMNIHMQAKLAEMAGDDCWRR